MYEKAATLCSKDYEVLYNYSVLLHKNKKYVSSNNYLNNAIKINDTANARILLAKNYEKLNKNSYANEEFLKAKHRESGNKLVIREEFYNLVKENSRNKALTYAEKVLNFENNYKEDFYNLAICYENIGDKDKAITFLKKTIEKDSSFQKAYYNLGLIYNSQNDFINAEKMLLISKKLKPRHVQTLRQLAKIYNLSNSDKHRGVLDNILTIEPYDHYANKKKGYIEYKDKKLTKALKHFKTALSSKEDTNILNTMGMIYLSENDLEKAKKVFFRGLYLEKYKSPKFFNNLGLTYLKQKKEESAKKMFRKALFLDQNYKLAKRNLELIEDRRKI